MVFSPALVFVVFILNGLLVAAHVDGRQQHFYDPDVRFRAAPGPAEIERFEAEGFVLAPPSPPPPREQPTREHSKPIVIPDFSSLASTTTRPHDRVVRQVAEVRSARSCSPGQVRFATTNTWTSQDGSSAFLSPIGSSTARLLEQRDHKQACHEQSHPKRMATAEEKVAE